ncbi:MAG: CPBP family intramembrane metalloprotease [Muribaculum sp.]
MKNESTFQVLRVSPGKSIFLFICWWILSTVFASVIIGYIGTGTVARMRWATLVQDIFMFIMPVVLTMLIVARQPMTFTGLGNRVTSRQVLWVILISILAIPAMNCLVAWNENIHFPQSMAGLEGILRGSEERARGFVDMLMGGDTVTDLLLGILIMGCLTGLAEELFFRGGMQPLLCKFMHDNHHAAIWATAVIFSAVHLQFFGFFPRVLMGAFFGYLFYWSGSLRLSVFAHALNNSLVVLNFWLMNKGIAGGDINTLGSQGGPVHIALAVASAVVTGAALYYFVSKISQTSCGGK